MIQAARTFTISTDKKKLDVAMIYGFLRQSYWAKDISLSSLLKAIESSFCVGLFDGSKQVGFCRIITDYATFAYLCDVFIVEEYRGRGWGKEMIDFCLNHPDLNNLRQWLLLTKDAQKFYQKCGFKQVENSQRIMSINNGNSKNLTQETSLLSPLPPAPCSPAT